MAQSSPATNYCHHLKVVTCFNNCMIKILEFVSGVLWEGAAAGPIPGVPETIQKLQKLVKCQLCVFLF